MQTILELKYILLGLKHFFINILSFMSSGFFVLVSLCAYMIGYPAQISILSAVLILFVLDIITKFYAIQIQCGGWYKAFSIGRLSSHAFRNGLVTKALGYFLILTVSNLSLITPQIQLIGKIISSIFYVGLFFAETYSNLENLRDAGWSAVKPFMRRIKKEQDNFFNDDK